MNQINKNLKNKYIVAYCLELSFTYVIIKTITFIICFTVA